MRGIQYAVLALVCASTGCLGLEPPFDTGEDEEEGLPDGAECEEDGDCRSHGCLYSKLCAPSFCNCPSDDCPAEGQASNDCSDNAVCVYYEDIFESVGETFNIEHDMNGGYCRPLCEKGCPEHFICSDGRYCTADSNWASPTPTLIWSGPVSGMVSGNSQSGNAEVEYGVPVTVMGSGSSPIGQAVRLQWMVVNSNAQRMVSNDTVEVSVESGQNYARVELQAIDEEGRSGLTTVIFDGCFGAGETCGYEGSGCCNGCDRDANTCM